MIALSSISIALNSALPPSCTCAYRPGVNARSGFGTTARRLIVPVAESTWLLTKLTVPEYGRPGRGDPAADGLDCAGEARCSYTAYGRRVAIVTAESGLPVSCDTVDAIVAQVPAGFACRGKIPVADRIDTWRQGAVALWLDADGIAVVGANESRGDRPWVPHPISRREREKAAAANRPAVPVTPPAEEPREAPSDARF